MCIEAAEKELPLDAIIWRSLAPALGTSPPRANGHADADADAGGDSGAWDLVQKALVRLFTTSVLVRLRVQTGTPSFRKLLMAHFAHAVSEAYDQSLEDGSSADVVAMVSRDTAEIPPRYRRDRDEIAPR